MFFNDTATTEIDPYLHTLSLHDALPIYAVGGGHDSRRRADRRRDGWRDLQYQRGYHGGRGGGRSRRVAAVSADGRGGRAGQAEEPADRSEEHTSELQSLMRISYAGFCWKKKKA